MKFFKRFLPVTVMMMILGTSSQAYEFQCTQQVAQACGTDKLCQLQYFTCCPSNEVVRKQDCEMCSGYWQQNSCSPLDPNGRKNALKALPAIITYLLN